MGVYSRRAFNQVNTVTTFYPRFSLPTLNDEFPRPLLGSDDIEGGIDLLDVYDGLVGFVGAGDSQFEVVTV